jgi:hypothetical protein
VEIHFNSNSISNGKFIPCVQCVMKFGLLASFHSAAETQAITPLMQGQDKWIGLQLVNGSEWRAGLILI